MLDFFLAFVDFFCVTSTPYSSLPPTNSETFLPEANVRAIKSTLSFNGIPECPATFSQVTEKRD